MDVDSSESKTVPLPSAKPVQIGSNVVLQPPLSRRGKGPALLIITPGEYTGRDGNVLKKILEPEPLQKWAEEGFTVAEVKVGSHFESFLDGCQKGIEALKSLPECTFDGKLGVIGMFPNLLKAKRSISRSMESSSSLRVQDR
jgi:carboxymethylenebutenolidase